MTDVNRMENPIRPAALTEARLAHPEVLECPFPTYELLLEQAPVGQDLLTGLYIISRYEDLREILRDTETCSHWRPSYESETISSSQKLAHGLFREHERFAPPNQPYAPHHERAAYRI